MSGPGRNDPCHCGSGAKYKRCCLAKDEAAHESRRRDEIALDAEALRSRGPYFEFWSDYRESHGEATFKLFDEFLESDCTITFETARVLLERMRRATLLFGAFERYWELTERLRVRAPKAWEFHSGVVRAHRIKHLLAQNLQAGIPPLLESLAQHRTGSPKPLLGAVEALLWHGRGDLVLAALRPTSEPRAPESNESSASMDRAVGAAIAEEWLACLPAPDSGDGERARSSSRDLPADPPWLKRYLRNLLGEPGKELALTDFMPGAPLDHTFDLGCQFAGWLHRERAWSWLRAQLAVHEWVLRLAEWRDVDLVRPDDPDEAAASPLCPSELTLGYAVEDRLHEQREHIAASLVHSLPAWLEYLGERKLITVEEAATVGSGWRNIHEFARNAFLHCDDPTLADFGAWPLSVPGYSPLEDGLAT